ncbi:MAG: hypothetical protein EOP11_19155, partial [Proteobacteria bacterium]
MKRLLLTLTLFLALAWSFRFGLSSGERKTGFREGSVTENLSLPASPESSGSAAGSRAESGKLAEVINDALDLRSAAPARPVLAKPAEYRGMFADAPVISSMTEYGPEPGQETATRIVQTKMKQPYVKIREIYEERNGQRTLVDQQAMVA